MSSSRGAVGQAKRAARIRRIVEEVMVRRAKGEPAPVGDIAAANPDLMPELGRELSLLSMLERARDSASGASRRQRQGPIEPLGEDAFSGYRMVREVRRGGQGVVYEAVQSSTGRRVAIKMMREGHFAGELDAARFEREVRILGQLDHPGIVGILASGIRAGHFYYVMEFVEGVPLDQYAGSIQRRVHDVMKLMERVAEAVNAAHLRGIIHRDLKPGNILVDAGGMPHVMDFGLARLAAADETRVTATGQFVGSMPWASPEQASGIQSRIDLRTDVYSLGVILYHALTGRFPYNVDAVPRDVLDNIMTATPPRLRSVTNAIDAGVEAITLKCLSKEPERRYQSAGELAADIHRFLSGRPVLAHPPTAWYQVRMFTRRHRALAVGAAAVLTTLALGLAGTTTGFLRASASGRQAIRDRDAARKAEAVADARRTEAESHAYAASISAADSALRTEDSASAKAHLRAAPEALRGWEWRYLAARADRSLETLSIPNLRDARVTPDGKSLMVMLRDGHVSLRNLADGTTRWTSDPPESAAGYRESTISGFSGDGRYAVTQHDGDFVLWNIADGQALHVLTVPDTTWGLSSAAFSPDGTRVAVSGRCGHVGVWDVESGRQLHDEIVEVSFSVGCDFSRDGRFLAVSSLEGVRLLDARSFATVRELKPPSLQRRDWAYLRFTQDSSLVIASCGTYLAAMDPDGVRPAVAFRGGGHTFIRFDISQDGKRVVAGSWDRAVRVWDIRTGDLELTLAGHDGEVETVGFALDGSRIYSTGADGLIKTWDSRPGGEPGMISHLGGHLLDVISPGDRALVHGLGVVKLADIAAEQLMPFTQPIPIMHALSASADGKRIAFSNGADTFYTMNLGTGETIWSVRHPTDDILCSRFSPDGARIAVTSRADGGSLTILDSANGAIVNSFISPTQQYTQVYFHPHEPELTAAGYRSSLRVWNTQSWISRTIEFPESPRGPLVFCGDYSPDGSLFAAGDGDGGVTLWTTHDWKVIHRLAGMNPAVWCLAFSPDGQRLAAGSQDRTIHVFQTSDWRETLILRGHSGTVHALAWTPDGRRLISGSRDANVRIWDAAPPTWDVNAQPKPVR